MEIPEDRTYNWSAQSKRQRLKQTVDGGRWKKASGSPEWTGHG